MRTEHLAQIIFEAAIHEGRCAELLEALFDGGTATVDQATGRLLVIPGDALAGLAEEQKENPHE